MIPAFSSAIRRRQSPTPSVWSWPTLVTTATWPSTTFVGSQRPSRPTSTTATSTATWLNHARPAAVSSSKWVGDREKNAWSSSASISPSTPASSSGSIG
jgi:hypothetical protein